MTDHDETAWQAEQARHDAAMAATLARWTIWIGSAAAIYAGAMLLIVRVLA